MWRLRVPDKARGGMKAVLTTDKTSVGNDVIPG